MKYLISRLFVVALISVSVGCASMLPSGKEVVKSPWDSFDQAQGAFDEIIPNETTIEELAELGFDPHKTPNIKKLNYLDVRRLFKYEPGYDSTYHPGVLTCLRAKDACLAYDVDVKDIKKKRVGNFWKDIFLLKREEQRTGWRFRAMIMIVDQQVVYKLSGGSPKLDETKTKKNPLGPIQELGPKLIDQVN